jgi:hypothetical protein
MYTSQVNRLNDELARLRSSLADLRKKLADTNAKVLKAVSSRRKTGPVALRSFTLKSCPPSSSSLVTCSRMACVKEAGL